MEKTSTSSTQGRIYPEFFHGRAVHAFVTAFLGENHTTEDAQKFIETIQETLADKGLIHPTDLREILLKDYTNNQDLKAVIKQLEEDAYTLDPVSHFIPNERQDLISAFAHMHATKNDTPVAIFEGDATNLGGTNSEMFDRVLNMTFPEKGQTYEYIQSLHRLSTKDEPRFHQELEQASDEIQSLYQSIHNESFELADRVIGIMTLCSAEVIQRHLPENASLYPMRIGGDEFRIIAEGITPEQYDTILDEIYAEQAKHLTALGLTHHKHPKKDYQHGTGIAWAPRNMQDQNSFNHTTFTGEIDEQVEAEKINILTYFSHAPPQNIPTSTDIKTYLEQHTTPLKIACAIHNIRKKYRKTYST